MPIIGNNSYIVKGKRGGNVISYDKLWETMERKHATTYTLQVKGGISSSTVRRLKANESVSTNTLDALCTVLGCKIEDIIEFIP